MKLKLLLLTLSLFYIAKICFAQQQTQVVKGILRDANSRIPLPGATVCLYKDTLQYKCTSTDDKGQFFIEAVELGRYRIIASMIGYTAYKNSNILAQSGKEVFLEIPLEESITQLQQIEVSTTQHKGEAGNQMATVSARTFSIEETERYAGSRSDPARMASNYAGVQGADDSRNDLIIRGNSPLGVLYRVDGIDIPNPNHFAVSGSTGGPVSVLNNKVMGNSDFYTGAFPSEYGNALAGVFDIKLRNGNAQKHEFIGQFGFLGTEALAEGPLLKDKGASYLINYRYSTLALFGALKIPIGTNSIPQYQDFFAKINIPTAKGGNISFFAMGGKSSVDIVISEQKDTSEIDLYGENDRDQYFRTQMAVSGISYIQPFSDKIFLKTTTALTHEQQKTHHDYIYRKTDSLGMFQLDSLTPLLDFKFNTNKIAHHTFVDFKASAKNLFKIGFTSDFLFFNMIDSVKAIPFQNWTLRWNYTTNAVLLQPYAQFKHRFTETFSLSIGLHSTYFTLNNTASWLEPRAGIKWQVNEKQIFTAAVGVHSQTQPYYTYFYQQYDTAGNAVLNNKNMGLSKSNHYIAGYEIYFGKNFRLKTEAYYQYLYNIPVEITPNAFSLINQGSGFSRFFPNKLINNGTANNYGAEITLEKFFSNNFFVLLTGSLFESKYKGSDGIERNTDFNGNYAANILIGKEFIFKNKNRLGFGTKATTAGGRRFGLVDTLLSNIQKEIVYQDSLYNNFQFEPYFRLDFKINYIINRRKVLHEFALDLVNITNHKNILSLTYAPVPGNANATPFRKNYQLGFLPLFYYRIQF